jgi:hypothetical protein
MEAQLLPTSNWKCVLIETLPCSLNTSSLLTAEVRGLSFVCSRAFRACVSLSFLLSRNLREEKCIETNTMQWRPPEADGCSENRLILSVLLNPKFDYHQGKAYLSLMSPIHSSNCFTGRMNLVIVLFYIFNCVVLCIVLIVLFYVLFNCVVLCIVCFNCVVLCIVCL